MSCLKPGLVDYAMHAGSFRCVPCERCLYRVLSSPFSRGRRLLPHSPSLCTVHFSFSWRPVGSLPRTVVSRTGPPPSFPLPSPFSLLLVTRPPARLPRRADLLYSPLFPPPPLAQEARHVSNLISIACTVCVSHPRRIHLRCIASHLHSPL